MCRLALVLIILIPLGCHADTVADSDSEHQTTSAESATDLENDPFNVTATVRRIEELGLPTPSVVAQMEQEARAAFESGNCRAAVPALREYAKRANWLANIISAGLEPFYRASYDDRRSLPSGRVRELAVVERAANDYKRKRNEAMVMQAECHAKLGEQEEAAALLINALKVTPADDPSSWDRARTELYRMVEMVDSVGTFAAR